MGETTLAESRIPCFVAWPLVVRLTGPAPLADTGFVTTIASVDPVPVSMERPWPAAPLVTAARFTPPGPIVTMSRPVSPTTEMPANFVTVFRFTAIVSVAGLIDTPGIGAADESRPALAAVIERTPVLVA